MGGTGSDRNGYPVRENTSEQVPDPVDGDVYSRELLKKIYELKDHPPQARLRPRQRSYSSHRSEG